MICNGCMTGVDSVVAHGATYDGKGNYMNAYIKIPTGGTATTKNIKFALTAGYTGTLTIKIGGYKDNPTVTLQPLTAGVLGSAITPTSGTVGGVATTENNFNAITWPLSTAGGTYVLTVTEKSGYISQIDMTTSTSATFNVTYNGNDNTGGTVPTDATNYASGATVTAAANSGTLVKTNYTGAGWNTANNGTGTNYVPGSGTFKITANTTLYAHWTQLITLAPGTQGTGTNNAAVSLERLCTARICCTHRIGLCPPRLLHRAFRRHEGAERGRFVRSNGYRRLCDLRKMEQHGCRLRHSMRNGKHRVC